MSDCVGVERGLLDWWCSLGKVPVLVKYDMMGRKSALRAWYDIIGEWFIIISYKVGGGAGNG